MTLIGLIVVNFPSIESIVAGHISARAARGSSITFPSSNISCFLPTATATGDRTCRLPQSATSSSALEDADDENDTLDDPSSKLLQERLALSRLGDSDDDDDDDDDEKPTGCFLDPSFNRNDDDDDDDPPPRSSTKQINNSPVQLQRSPNSRGNMEGLPPWPWTLSSRLLEAMEGHHHHDHRRSLMSFLRPSSSSVNNAPTFKATPLICLCWRTQQSTISTSQHQQRKLNHTQQ